MNEKSERSKRIASYGPYISGYMGELRDSTDEEIRRGARDKLANRIVDLLESGDRKESVKAISALLEYVDLRIADQLAEVSISQAPKQ